ncbi:hypothetical protein GPA10_37375 [Streptomyces sp. p1417]|uniref:Uncharacterized protein n=1 Tax=Streptomyces typhae TaxID=2681492 RepID=A0A6L6X8W5_9ACTN|nr:hypothetical protein [Streptomyces typhae]MVO90272.1 hypothetical protein [Streptomyces typhae]
MSGTEQPPAFGLSFDPRALSDLLAAPSDIRDLALAQLQDVVNARLFGPRLLGELADCRKLYVDHRNAWRIVYAQRPAPTGSAYRAEIHVVAVRPRERHEVYSITRKRLGITHRPLSALAHAARSRSPQLEPRREAPKPTPPSYAPPGLLRPVAPPSLRGRAR